LPHAQLALRRHGSVPVIVSAGARARGRQAGRGRSAAIPAPSQARSHEYIEVMGQRDAASV